MIQFAVRRMLIRKITIAIAAIVLVSCHPLINPVDPKSSAYIGTRAEPDAQPKPSLPEITKWEIYAEHGMSPGPFVRMPLTIPENGVFIEPRAVDAITNLFEIEITFAEPVTDGDLEGGTLLVGFASSTLTMVHEVGSPDVELIDGGQRLTYFFDVSSQTAPYQFSLTMRIVDPNQLVLDERTVYFLTGDVDGNGLVDADDANGTVSVNAVFGQNADPRRPLSVRADVDVSGTVDATDLGDVVNAAGGTTSAIPNLVM